jgi:hypothetical protein
MTATPRRFPPPWSVDELEACFVVRELAYVYFEEEPGRQPRYRRFGSKLI